MSYQGAQFRLGRGQSFVAIWPAGAPVEQPLERWPATPDGWSAAWSRFNELEVDGTIVPVAKTAATARRPKLRALVHVTNSAALLMIGVAFGIVGLFPDYVGGSSLASQSVTLVPHLLYLAAWTLGGVGVLMGGTRARAGAAIALGVSAVTLGMFVTDAGQVGSGVSAGTGLYLACIGWLACAAGSVLAIRSVSAGRLLARPRGGQAGVMVMLGMAAVGVAIMFALAWDSYQLTAAATGQTQTITLGNAFDAGGVMIAGNVIVMLLFVATAVLAGAWRSGRMGAMLLFGALIPLVAQAISALIQQSQSTSPTTFNISPAQASALGLTITNGMTAWFWLFCVFMVALVISAAWMLLSPATPSAEHVSGVPSAGGSAAYPALTPPADVRPASTVDAAPAVDADASSSPGQDS
jgi:hypothetical protein